MNSWGDNIRVTLFGASHAPCVGVTVEGLPVGMAVDMPQLQAFLDTRRGGGAAYTTARAERDVPRFLCGMDGSHITGDTVTAVFDNACADPAAYAGMPLRPGHADYTACLRYGSDYDMRGGGSFSGRLTLPLCLAGGLCLQLLQGRGVSVDSRILSVGGETDEGRFEEIMLDAARRGDSVGGEILCQVTGIPGGLGSSLFGNMEGRLSSILFSVPAVKAVEFGDTQWYGSENNDAFVIRDGQITCRTNHAGGILGGITTGMPVFFRVKMKPAPSISLPQDTVDIRTGQETRIQIAGRHDACILPRAVPVITAAAAVAVTDMMLEAGK